MIKSNCAATKPHNIMLNMKENKTIAHLFMILRKLVSKAIITLKSDGSFEKLGHGKAGCALHLNGYPFKLIKFKWLTVFHCNHTDIST